MTDPHHVGIIAAFSANPPPEKTSRQEAN